MILKAARDLKPHDRLKMSIGFAVITDVQPLPDNRMLFTFLAGTKVAADNDVTVLVLEDEDF